MRSMLKILWTVMPVIICSICFYFVGTVDGYDKGYTEAVNETLNKVKDITSKFEQKVEGDEIRAE